MTIRRVVVEGRRAGPREGKACPWEWGLVNNIMTMVAPVSVFPVPMGILNSPQISLALRNQDSGPLNLAIDRNNHRANRRLVSSGVLFISILPM